MARHRGAWSGRPTPGGKRYFQGGGLHVGSVGDLSCPIPRSTKVHRDCMSYCPMSYCPRPLFLDAKNSGRSRKSPSRNLSHRRRWAVAGVDLQDDAAIDRYLAGRSTRPAKADESRRSTDSRKGPATASPKQSSKGRRTNGDDLLPLRWTQRMVAADTAG
jgi:hypothetical protein